VVVNPGTAVEPVFSQPQSTVPNVSYTHPVLTYNDALVDLLEAAVLGLNYKDANGSTIDFFVVGSTWVWQTGLHAAAAGDVALPDLPGWENSVFATLTALPPTAPDNTHVPGHEVGHCLFNVGSTGHSPIPTNLFHSPATVEPNVYGTKRLTNAQNTEARAQSDIPSFGPLLLQHN
jgi:hypothetical protein